MFETKSRYFRVNRSDLVYLKFILEAYEGLSVLSTVDSTAAVVRIGYPHFFQEDMDRLLTALSAEIELTEVQRPEGFRDGLPDIPQRKVATDA